jgi:hypothetical protein
VLLIILMGRKREPTRTDPHTHPYPRSLFAKGTCFMPPTHLCRFSQYKRVARQLAGLGAVAVLSGASLPVLAEPPAALDRASFSIGAFHADPTFNAAVNTRFGRLDSGNVDSSSTTMPRIKADVLLFDSQGLAFDYYQFKRGYSESLASNFNVGSGTVTTTGNANLDVKIDFAKLAYKWWFGSGNTVLGLGAGAAYYRVGLDLNANAAAGGANGSISESYSDDAVAKSTTPLWGWNGFP